MFQFVAEFDFDDLGSPYSGSLSYTDASAGVQITSNTLVDYVADWTWRAAVYVGPGFEARVFIYDFGSIGDLFEIQIFTNGGFYSAAWLDGGEDLKDLLDAYNNGELCAPARD